MSQPWTPEMFEALTKATAARLAAYERLMAQEAAQQPCPNCPPCKQCNLAVPTVVPNGFCSYHCYNNWHEDHML